MDLSGFWLGLVAAALALLLEDVAVLRVESVHLVLVALVELTLLDPDGGVGWLAEVLDLVLPRVGLLGDAVGSSRNSVATLPTGWLS